MNKDTKTISNEYHELEYAAKQLKVPVWQVMKAKEEVGNLRSKVYKYIRNNAKYHNKLWVAKQDKKHFVFSTGKTGIGKHTKKPTFEGVALFTETNGHEYSPGWIQSAFEEVVIDYLPF